ncbi:MAG: VCBS repeat-containing protein [Candidatus Omnitrophota bacterium]|nr:MAG: VCBS repeat-containing protein [Candidatus Omnitrophota bacterium]
MIDTAFPRQWIRLLFGFLMIFVFPSYGWGQAITVTRDYPRLIPPGESMEVVLSVQIHVTPSPYSLLIREAIPDGWRFVSVSQNHFVLDQETGELTGIISHPDGLSPATITYILSPSVPVTEPPVFAGTFLYLDEVEQPVYGSIVTLIPTPTPTFTYTVTPTHTMTNTPTNTFTPTQSPSNTPTFTSTYTPIPPTNTPTPTPTEGPTSTPLPTIVVSKVSLSKLGVIPLNQRPEGFLSADFDNDGLDDLATMLRSTNEIVILKTTGDIHHPIIKTTTTLGENVETEFLSHGDFNGDGNQDLCVVSYLDETLLVALGNGDGTFRRPIATDVPFHVIAPERHQPLICMDTDADGNDEIYVVVETRGLFNQIRKYELTDDATRLVGEEVILRNVAATTIQMIDMQHLDGETPPALILVSLDSNPAHPSSVIFCRRQSPTEFQNIAEFSLWQDDIGDRATAFKTGDANADAFADFVTLSFSNHAKLYTAFDQQTITAIPIGDVDFTQTGSRGAILEDVTISDFDLDGLPDLIYVSRETGAEGNIFALITVVRGKQLNAWEEALTFRTDFPAKIFSWMRLEAVDFNRDGLPDLAFLESSSAEVILLLNTSDPPATPTPVLPPPTSTPTPSPTPIAVDWQRLADNKLPVSDFTDVSSLTVGEAPTDNAFPGATDGIGLVVNLKPGEGNLLMLAEAMETGQRLIELSVSARCSSNQVQLGLVAIADPIDGSLGYVNPKSGEIPVDRWGTLRLVYDAPTTHIHPALQIVLPREATDESVTVYFDNLQIKPFEETETDRIEPAVDSTFNAINDAAVLNPNQFLPPGAIPGTVSLTAGMNGQGVRLGLEADQLAAHVVLYSAIPPQAGVLQGEVMMKRASGEGGMTAVGLIDEDQSVIYFLRDNHIPSDGFRKIKIAGNFESIAPGFPPVLVIQYGGPNVSGSIIIDEAGMEQKR